MQHYQMQHHMLVEPIVLRGKHNHRAQVASCSRCQEQVRRWRSLRPARIRPIQTTAHSCGHFRALTMKLITQQPILSQKPGQYEMTGAHKSDGGRSIDCEKQQLPALVDEKHGPHHADQKSTPDENEEEACLHSLHLASPPLTYVRARCQRPRTSYVPDSERFQPRSKKPWPAAETTQ
jgi:hypothetical protein